MTAEHLQPILENGRDAAAIVSFATALAQGEVPKEAFDGIKMDHTLPACAQHQGRLRVRGAYFTVQHRIG